MVRTMERIKGKSVRLFDMIIDAGCSFPCPACGDRLGNERNVFCSSCLDNLLLIRPPRCPGCGGNLDGVLQYCSRCMQFEKRPWRGALALFELRGTGRHLVHRFKFRDAPGLARPFAALAEQLLIESNFSIDLIVPVPLHWSRRWSRGYNQAGLLCNELSRRVGVPDYPVLRRVKRTRQQSTLTREQRLKNLDGAFAVKPGVSLGGKSLLLVDDVITTGVTLGAATTTLLENGADAVYILVIGRR